MKNLTSLLNDTEYISKGNEKLLTSPVASLCSDSREAREGSAFFCLVGARADGHSFAREAYENGTRVFFCERPIDLPENALQITVKNSRAALARISAAFFDHPEKKLTLIGVTGTKGKSTVCEMIAHILNSSGKKCAVIGTIGIKIDGETQKTANSTPESFIIYKALAEAASRGMKYAAVEVSSQALCTHRTEGLRFAAAVFTNLSRDHIGEHEHPTFEHYKNAKKSLFSRADAAFINADDAFAGEFSRASACPVYTYGISDGADIRAKDLCAFRTRDTFGVSFKAEYRGEKASVALPLPGDFSARSALCALAVCRRFGVPLSASEDALASVRVRGRFEAVPCTRKDITCVIDYAHNAVSLLNALSVLRGYARGRLICIFGSVGGRTRERRRELGQTAARLADLCIVTSDNPDFEAPEDIISEIAAHIPAEKCICITDRAEAVAYALDTAEDGDLLLFAGKGHEEYQLVNGKKLPFSERELIKNHKFKNLIPSP